MTEPTMANNMTEEQITTGEKRLDIKVGPPSKEYFERQYREFMDEYKSNVKFVYTEDALKKVLKADLIKDLIKLNERNHMIRKELLHPEYIDYISSIENLQAIIENDTKTRFIIERSAERKLDKVEEEKRLLLLRIAELEEQLNNK